MRFKIGNDGAKKKVFSQCLKAGKDMTSVTSGSSEFKIRVAMTRIEHLKRWMTRTRVNRSYLLKDAN
jgi:hypothetical protein